MAKILKDPFEVELLRSRYAVKKAYKKLLSTYSIKYPEIKDLNTSKLWDNLHYNSKKDKIDHPMANDRLGIVSKLIKGQNISVLDIGFGSASLERKYFKNNPNKNTWSGIEISPVSVRKAKKEFPYVSFKLGDIKKIGYFNDTFDYVIALEILEHIRPSKLFKSLSEVYRVIKPGKFFIVSIPMNEGLKTMIANGENPNAHVRTYTPELIKAELEITGFKILEERKLFAFHKYYKLKSFIANNLLRQKFSYNNIIIMAQKPII